MTRTAIVIASLFLMGCGVTPQGDAFRDALLSLGADASRGGLKNAEAFICEIAPVGLIRELYFNNPARAAAWIALCGAEQEYIPSKAPPNG